MSRKEDELVGKNRSPDNGCELVERLVRAVVLGFFRLRVQSICQPAQWGQCLYAMLAFSCHYLPPWSLVIHTNP